MDIAWNKSSLTCTLEVRINWTSFLCGSRSGHHNTDLGTERHLIGQNARHHYTPVYTNKTQYDKGVFFLIPTFINELMFHIACMLIVQSIFRFKKTSSTIYIFFYLNSKPAVVLRTMLSVWEHIACLCSILF